jgi:hypothetical protein
MKLISGATRGMGDMCTGEVFSELVVARPCEASWVLVVLWYSVCGPFVARGAQGEEEYP